MLERRMAASPVDGLIVYPEGALPAAPAPPPTRYSQPHAMSRVEAGAERKRIGGGRGGGGGGARVAPPRACARHRGGPVAPQIAQALAALGPARTCRARAAAPRRKGARARTAEGVAWGRAQATAASAATRCR